MSTTTTTAAAARQARCYCGQTRPSSDRANLFGFEDLGPGSKHATDRCACGYHLTAHDPAHMRNLVVGKTVVEQGLCAGFVATGPADFDTYYCGCSGWD